MAPSHYLAQCWFISKTVLLHLPENNFTMMLMGSIHNNSSKVTLFLYYYLLSQGTMSLVFISNLPGHCKILAERILRNYANRTLRNKLQWIFYQNSKIFHSKRCTWKCLLKWHPFCLCLNVITHWGWDRMATISQTTVSNVFLWMKMLVFR